MTRGGVGGEGGFQLRQRRLISYQAMGAALGLGSHNVSILACIMQGGGLPMRRASKCSVDIAVACGRAPKRREHGRRKRLRPPCLVSADHTLRLF